MLETLNDWQTFDVFDSLVEIISPCGDRAVTSPHYQSWRDAWIARETAREHRASHVCLVAEERPDFAIRIGHAEFLYEATEALKPKRRRHDEYRAINNSENSILDDPVGNWLTPERALEVLHSRATEKSKIKYPPGCRLVIYVNFGWINGPWSIGASLIEQLGFSLIAEAVDIARTRFDRIELLHHGKLFEV